MSATLKSLRRLIKFRPGPFLATVGAFTALLLAGCQHPERPKAAADADWQSLIPADLVPPPHIVPPAENAISNWLFATEHLVRLKNSDDSLALATFGNLRKDGAIPATQRALFRDHLKTNAVVLAAFAAGIEQGSFSREGITNRFSLSALKSLIELRRVETRFLIEEEEWAGAVSSLTADLRVPKMLKDDGDGMIDFLVALALQGIINEQILSLAENPQTPPTALVALGNHISPTLIDRSDLVHAFRRIAYGHLTNSEAFSRFLTAPTELQEVVRNQVLGDSLDDGLPDLLLDPELMRLHPKPLDLAKTISIQAQHFTETIKVLENRSTPFDFEAFGREAAAALNEECQALLGAAEEMETPLSREQAKRLAAPFRKIENPIGRLMLSYDPFDMVPKVEDRLKRLQTTTQITRLALDLALFQRQQGRWPNSLQELPAVQATPDLAEDAYSGTAFRYSAEAHRVWSVAAENSKPGAIPEARTNRVRGLFWPTLPD